MSHQIVMHFDISPSALDVLIGKRAEASAFADACVKLLETQYGAKNVPKAGWEVFYYPRISNLLEVMSSGKPLPTIEQQVAQAVNAIKPEVLGLPNEPV